MRFDKELRRFQRLFRQLMILKHQSLVVFVYMLKKLGSLSTKDHKIDLNLSYKY